jgi:predicted transcriptional regulator of viral defense system
MTDFGKLLPKNLKGRSVFSAPELIRVLGHRTAIQRLTEEGQLISLGAGYYFTPKIDPSSAQAHVIGRFYPNAVISGLSALFIHGLSDEMPERITVDIPKSMSLRNRLIEARRIVDSRLIGITKIDYKGAKIRVYDIERSLCDAYRIDRGATFFKAIKLYVEKYSPNTYKIALYDKKLGTRVLVSLQQELADVR